MISRFKRITQALSGLKLLSFLHKEYINDLKNPKILLGKVLHNQNLMKDIKSIDEVEFSIFSQWGDDGIIQYIISKIDFPNKTFVEFGVENYRESNTRFLLINNNWHGLVIDGSTKNVDYINSDVISWAHHLMVEHAFITRENINVVLSKFIDKGYHMEIGILSIDIDGNDYWIWKEITVINPILVIVEYNAVFGEKNAWTIPYRADFSRYSLGEKGYLYFGASLEALKLLAEEKGYVFIGCNSNGNNAYFLRKDKINGLSHLLSRAKFVDSEFQELWIIKKHNIYYGPKRLEFIKGEEIFDLLTKSIVKIESN
jgi:hypothetical protein